MAKRVDISLLKGGDEIVSSQILTDHLSLDGLDVDGLRLQGFDNYMIEERRAKCSIQLATYNEAFNEQLIGAMTDKDNRSKDLLGAYPNLATLDAFVFDKNTAISNTKDSDLFRRELSNPDSMMQNRSDNVLTVQSKLMMDMFLTMMDDPILWKGSVGGVFNEMGVSTTSTSSRINPRYKYGNAYFNNMLVQTLSFLHHGIKLEYPYHNPKTQFKVYLNSIRSGLGDGIESLMSNNNPSRNLGWIFFIRVFIGYDNDEFSPLKYEIIPSVYKYLRNNNWSIDIPDNDPINVSNMANTESNRNFVFAAFLASIVKYDWYVSVKDDFFRENMDASKCIDDGFPMGAIPYIPFYRAIEVVRRKNSSNPSLGQYNIFLPWVVEDGEWTLDVRRQIPALMFYTNLFMGSYGKPQRKTAGDDSIHFDVGNFADEYTEEGLFIPVRRMYKLKNTDFGSVPADIQYLAMGIVDILNYANIIGNIDDNFMCLTHYETTNWMYHDNISVIEEYNPLSAFTDAIPIRTDGDEAIMFAHKDAFNKIYQVERSNLMDIRLEIKVDSKLVYTGWIDYTTIEISGGRLSFTATDAIGVLIENLDKLDGVIYFSQFDKGGKLVADKRAGHVILDFINRMAYNPIPYKPLGWKPVNNLLDAPRGSILNNKVLDDINPKDAFLIALQASQRVLYANGDGSLALDDISYLNDVVQEEDIIMLDNKYISEKALSFGIDTEEFNEEHLVKLAGNKSILEDVIKFFNRNKSDTQKTLSITTTQDFDKDVKLLDTIELDGELWTVNEIEYIRM